MSTLTTPLIAPPNKPAADSSRKSPPSIDDLFPLVLEQAQVGACRVADIQDQCLRVVGYDDGALVGTRSGKIFYVSLTGESQFIGCHTQFIFNLVVCRNICASVSGDGTLKTWNLSEKTAIDTVDAHHEGAWVVLFIPGEEQLITCGTDGKVRIWALDPLRQLYQLDGHTEAIWQLSLTNDAKRAVTASKDCTVRVWSLTEKREIAAMTGHNHSEMWALKVSSDDSIALTAVRTGQIKVWSLKTYSELHTFEDFCGTPRGLAITPDASKLIVVGDFKPTVWSLTEFKNLGLLVGHEWGCWNVIAIDNQYCVTSSGDNTVKVWDLDELKMYANLTGHTSAVMQSCYIAKKKALVSVSNDKSARIWKLDFERNVFKEHSQAVNCLAVSHRLNLLASGSADHTIKIWSFASNSILFTLQSHSSSISVLQFSFDERFLVSGDEAGEVRLWDCMSFIERGVITDQKKKVTCMAQTFDGKYIFTGSEDSTILVCTYEPFAVKAVLKGHSNLIFCLAVSRDDRYLHSGGADCLEKAWDLSTFTEASTHSYMARVTSIFTTIDRKYILVGDNQKNITVWSTADFSKVKELRGHLSTLWNIIAIPNQQKFASSDGYGGFRIWDLECLKEDIVIQAHECEKSINKMIAFPSGKYLATVAENGEVKVWSLESYNLVFNFKGHSKSVTSVVLSPDCKYLITASEDCTIRKHDVSTLAELGNFTAEEIEESHTKLDGNYLLGDCLPDLIKGKGCNIISAFRTFEPYKFNALHIFAYFNHPTAIVDFLAAGSLIIRGAFGSPLSVTLRRHTRKCMDAILASINAAFETSSNWLAVQLISDDIPELLKKKSPHIREFFEKVLRAPTQQDLPLQIVPLSELPVVAFLPTWKVYIEEFAQMENGNLAITGSQVVEIKTSEFKINLTTGSKKALELINAFENMEDTELLKTPLVKTIINYKWDTLWPITFIHTLLYCLMLIALILITFQNSLVVSILWWQKLFLALNILFLFYEGIQMLTSGFRYWDDPWNYVDLLHSFIAIIWIVTFENSLQLCVVGFCFFRGFTFFRTFKMTRMFVRLTLEVVKEMYSFLVILAFSTLTFGMMYATLNPQEILSASDAWTTAYKLLMGDFSTDGFSSVQWVCFTTASLVNIIIMLNLLISILGDAYGKAQASAEVNDALAQLHLIVEYESLFFWRKEVGTPSVVVVCQDEEDEARDENQIAMEAGFAGVQKQIKELNEKVVEIEKKIDASLSTVIDKLNSIHV